MEGGPWSISPTPGGASQGELTIGTGGASASPHARCLQTGPPLIEAHHFTASDGPVEHDDHAPGLDCAVLGRIVLEAADLTACMPIPPGISDG